ncbi:signal transduction histidine kinase [Frigoribacterium sp. CG_9.8]|nr:signal transduction histidine kinase [Frigoribacterium sp. CG_9.8]
MLIARVIHDEVHHDLDAAGVRLGEQLVELLERSEEWVDVLVVA